MIIKYCILNIWEWFSPFEKSLAVFQNVKPRVLYDPTIPLLGTYITKRIETRCPHKTNSQIFITSLFITAPPKWKQPKCPSTYQWISKMQCIHAMKNYSAIKWMKFWYMPQYEWTLKAPCYVKEARLKRPHTVSFHFIWNVQSRRIHRWKVD